MPKANKTLKHLLCTTTLASSVLASSYALATTYNNMFISYFTPKNVKTMENYANTNGLGGYIMWEAQGDLDPATETSKSLLYTLNPNQDHSNDVMTYWADWSVYNQGRGQPIASYPIPGSTTSSGTTAKNQDLTDKIPFMNTLAYAFLEAQTTKKNSSQKEIGTLYFFDPWSDLTPDDSFCDQGNNIICGFVPQQKGTPFPSAAHMGNFEAFAKLPKQHSGLKTSISVGGYGHDNTYKSIFTPNGGLNSTYAANFINSATSIMNHYHIDGIDLDYEDPNMTHAQSQSFGKLVEKLNSKLTASQFITIATMANPAYLTGSENNNTTGFATGVLKTIASLSHVKSIDVMTYDFHGAFDYNPNDPEQSRTGFITNVFMPNNAPANYDPRFSVDTSVQALEKQVGVPANKIVIGIPAYGRALANIPQGGQYNGLFQQITSSTIIPRGDMDQGDCLQTLPLSNNSCNGMFSYSFIVKHLLGKDFTGKDWKDNNGNVSNGTTAYASSWTPAAGHDYTLEVTNTGSGSSFGFTISNSSASFNGGGYYISAGSDKTYNKSNPPAPTSIESQNDLKVSWSNWQGKHQCSGSFDFDGNYHVMINPDTKKCAIKKM